VWRNLKNCPVYTDAYVNICWLFEISIRVAFPVPAGGYVQPTETVAIAIVAELSLAV